MNPPARDPGDLDVADGAEPTLEIPEMAKSSSTPKRFRHVIPFALLGLLSFDLNAGWLHILRLGFFQAGVAAASAGRPTRLNRSWNRGLFRKASMLGSI